MLKIKAIYQITDISEYQIVYYLKKKEQKKAAH